MEEKRKRKTRSDKKREFKPTVHITLYECISRLSYITRTPMKDVAEFLCEAGLNSRETIEVIAPNFKRNYVFQNTTYVGEPEIQRSRAVEEKGTRQRLSLRFNQKTDDKIECLAYSLGVTPTSAVSILLKTSVKNTDFLDEYIAKNVYSQLDDARKDELEEVLDFIKKDNPFEEDVSLAILVSMILGDVVHGVKEKTISAKRSVENWLDNRLTKDTSQNSKTVPKTNNGVKSVPVKQSTVLSSNQTPTKIGNNISKDSTIQVNVNGKDLKLKTLSK